MAGLSHTHTHTHLVTHTCQTERSAAQTWSILVMKMILACCFVNKGDSLSIEALRAYRKPLRCHVWCYCSPITVDGTSQLLIGHYGRHINGAMGSSVAAPSSDCYCWPFSGRVNWAAVASKLQTNTYIFSKFSLCTDESLCIRVLLLETGVPEKQ